MLCSDADECHHISFVLILKTNWIGHLWKDGIQKESEMELAFGASTMSCFFEASEDFQILRMGHVLLQCQRVGVGGGVTPDCGGRLSNGSKIKLIKAQTPILRSSKAGI